MLLSEKIKLNLQNKLQILETNHSKTILTEEQLDNFNKELIKSKPFINQKEYLEFFKSFKKLKKTKSITEISSKADFKESENVNNRLKNIINSTIDNIQDLKSQGSHLRNSDSKFKDSFLKMDRIEGLVTKIKERMCGDWGFLLIVVFFLVLLVFFLSRFI